ncbi:MAG: penicillin-binding protein 2 [Actinomycetota bacterium]
MTEGKVPARLRWLAVLCAFMFAALGTRLWFMQVLASEQFRAKARHNGIRLVYDAAPRGRIFDRRGALLVGNRPSLTVLINRQQLGTHEEEVLFRLARLLHMPIGKIVDRLNDKRYYIYTPVPIRADVPKSVQFYIEEHSDPDNNLFPGVTISYVPARTYTHGNLAAHILGNTGEISEQQLQSPEFRSYQLGDVVGQAGVEATYERWLQGTKGEEKLQVNASGKTIQRIGGTDPVPGDDVVLSIDAHTQYLAEHSLILGEQEARKTFDPDTGRHYAADAGAVVVMNPRNGQILALASNPTYDPRVFLNGLSTTEYKDLTKESRHNPLFDRAIQAQYPPGSTFKPFVALSALRRGLATPYGNYDCPGEYAVPGDTSGTVFHNWTPANSGYISLAQALNISCDTVFYDFGYRFWQTYANSGPGAADNSKLSEWQGRKNLLQDDLRTFGFDRLSGVDLPYEQDGRIPDGRWKAEVHEQDPTNFPYPLWLPGDSINMSIGQGDTLVTPLQLATAFSSIANGGTVWQPHVGLIVRRPDGRVVKRIQPRSIGRLPFSKSYLGYVRSALTNVPMSGTAESAFVGFPFAQVPVAGKTGSAEVRPFQTYSWFAAMAPATDPQYVVVCLVEQGGHGSTTAAPVVRKILEGLFDLPSTPGISLGQVAD